MQIIEFSLGIISSEIRDNVCVHLVESGGCYTHVDNTGNNVHSELITVAFTVMLNVVVATVGKMFVF